MHAGAISMHDRRMAVDVVQSALESVLSRPECQIKTDRSRLVKSNYEKVTAALRVQGRKQASFR